MDFGGVGGRTGDAGGPAVGDSGKDSPRAVINCFTIFQRDTSANI